MSNYTPATATTIGSLPFTATVSAAALEAAPASALVPGCYTPTHTVWFVFTPPAGLNVLGVTVADSSNNAGISIWAGNVSAPTEVTGACQVIPGSIAVPVTAFTPYYIALDANQATATAAVTIGVVACPFIAAPIGSLLITNDEVGGPAAVISATTGATLQNFGLPSCEMGDVSASGIVCLLAEKSSDATLAASLNLYTPALGLASANTAVIIPNQAAVSSVRSDGAHTFYMLAVDGSSAPTLQALLDTGVVGPTWTLPINGAASTAMAPNRAGTIAYYAAGGGVSALIVHAYDLVGHAPLSDLVNLGTGLTAPRDLLVLSNGNILVPSTNGTTASAHLYNPAGSLQHTYALGTNSGSVFRVALGLDDPNSFWVWSPLSTDPRTTVVTNVKVSDGSTLHTFTVQNQELSDDSTAALFSPSASCPILVLRVALSGPGAPVGGASAFQGWTPVLVSDGAPRPPIPPPPGPTITVPMRRVRIGPHLSAMQVRTIFDMFQLDAQFLGTVDTPAPVINLAYSDDGGFTWSLDLALVAGPPGNYAQQFKWFQLGQSRNRVFKVWTDSPVVSVLIAAYLRSRPGTS